MKRKVASNDAPMNLKEVNMSTKHGKYFLVTTDKTTVCVDKHNIIVSSTIGSGDQTLSGKIVLCICTLNHQTGKTGLIWGKTVQMCEWW